jgi:RNA polymerase sigma-70 factor (ECF subfamily)
LKINKTLSELSDEDLLKKFLQTDDIVFFGELYRRNIPLVYGLCLKYLEDKDAAYDAVMDIFEDIVKKVSQYDIKNFNTWLYSVAKYHCFHVIKKDKRAFFVKIEDTVVESDDFFTLSDVMQTEEETEALTYCIGTLSNEQQVSINYFYLEEKSYADIVKLTGFPLSKVKSYIQNGKRNLKTCILKVLGQR